MSNNTKSMLFNTYELSLRLFAAVFLMIYGLAKPWQFGDAFSSNATPVNELNGMSLMWAFFAYSKVLPIIIGCLECAGAVLLAFNRTKLWGALLLLPVLTNIVLFDLFYGVAILATVNAIFYLAIVIFVLALNFKTVRSAAVQLLVVENVSLEKKQSSFSAARVFALVLFLFLNFATLMVLSLLGQTVLT